MTFGDKTLPRPWSKYSEGSSAYKIRNPKRKLEPEMPVEERDADKNMEKVQRLNQTHHKSKLTGLLNEYYDLESDPEFLEFLAAHKTQATSKVWSNDTGLEEERPSKKRKKEKVKSSLVSVESKKPGGKGLLLTRTHLKFQEEDDDMDQGQFNIVTISLLCNIFIDLSLFTFTIYLFIHSSIYLSIHPSIHPFLHLFIHSSIHSSIYLVINLSDISCIHSLTYVIYCYIVLYSFLFTEQSKREDEATSLKHLSDMDYLKSKMITKYKERETTTTVRIEEEKETNTSEEKDINVTEEVVESDKPSQPAYTLRMRGLPYRATENDIRTFFYPLSLSAVRILTDSGDKSTGLAFVDFSNESDLQEALSHNKDCMGQRYIELFRDDGHIAKEKKTNRKRPWEDKMVEDNEDESIAETGRLFVRNLPYTTTEENLTKLFEAYGQLTETSLLVDKNTGNSIGLAYITYMFPEHAVKAFTELDRQIFQGRLLHILPSKPPHREVRDTPSTNDKTVNSTSSYKKKQAEKLKSQAGNAHSWNTLFLGSNAVVDAMTERYSVSKSDILDLDTKQSLAVRLALGETQLVAETKDFLEQNGVVLEVFEQEKSKRSKNVILAKNLPFGTTAEELKHLFSEFGSLSRVILPPAGISALIEFSSPSGAKRAFKKLAYTEFKHLPLYLEWAPFGVMCGQEESAQNVSEPMENESESVEPSKEKEHQCLERSDSKVNDEDEAASVTVFVKNLNFSTTEDSLRELFQSTIGGVKNAIVAKKHNKKDPSTPLSMGYGFVTFTSQNGAIKAIKGLQNYELDGHKLELKLSRGWTQNETAQRRKGVKNLDQKSSKILVRNIPFEANTHEVKQLFSTFGNIKNVRLPKKINGQGEHRGFGFVEYVTKEDACSAFESLCGSTHLYGRRLVLEWADEEESVADIRKRTARYYESNEGVEPVLKRRKQLANDLLSSLHKISEDED